MPHTCATPLYAVSLSLSLLCYSAPPSPLPFSYCLWPAQLCLLSVAQKNAAEYFSNMQKLHFMRRRRRRPVYWPPLTHTQTQRDTHTLDTCRTAAEPPHPFHTALPLHHWLVAVFAKRLFALRLPVLFRIRFTDNCITALNISLFVATAPHSPLSFSGAGCICAACSWGPCFEYALMRTRCVRVFN